MNNYIVKETDVNKRLDMFLSSFLSISRNKIQSLIKSKHILVNNKNIISSYKLKLNDIISYQIEEEKQDFIPNSDIKIDIVYEDDDIVIINKPQGLVVHPSIGHHQDTLVNGLKYVFDDKAFKYSRAENYFNVAINAIEIMKSQVGDLTVNDNGIAERGIIIRHLILPNNESDSYDVLIELKERGFLKSTISLMSQYNPKFKALDFENINRKLYKKEYDDVVDYALDLGFENLLVQEMESSENYLPDFTKEKPFQM